MSSGRERSVLVWEARFALASERLTQIERSLAELSSFEEPPSRKRRERVIELEAERRQVTRTIASLGPSPQAKMG
ncbi:MAG TPA: hypothetical protein VF808_08520 [Ktedonobacterales bacterium]